MASRCARGGSGWILGKNYSQKSGEALAQAAQGGGGVTIPGGVQKLWRCGTEDCGYWPWWGYAGVGLDYFIGLWKEEEFVLLETSFPEKISSDLLFTLHSIFN